MLIRRWLRVTWLRIREHLPLSAIGLQEATDEMDMLAGLELGVTESSAGTVEIVSTKVTVATCQWAVLAHTSGHSTFLFRVCRYLNVEKSRENDT